MSTEHQGGEIQHVWENKPAAQIIREMLSHYGLIKELLHAALDFREAMIKIQTSVGASQEELQQLSQGIMDMATIPRDTQFKGFAKLLSKELDWQVGEVTMWAIEHDINDEAMIEKELASRWQATIARRVYDFACHVSTHTILSAHGDMSKIPDLTALPEESN
jgi:hypothetical protein